MSMIRKGIFVTNAGEEDIIESVVVMTIIRLIAKAWLGIFVVECNIEIILESDVDLNLLN